MISDCFVVVVAILQSLFNHAKEFYAGGEGSKLEAYLAEKEAQNMKQDIEARERIDT